MIYNLLIFIIVSDFINILYPQIPIITVLLLLRGKD